MARLFDGSSSACSVPNVASINDFAVAFRFQYVVTGTSKTIFEWDNYPATPRYACGLSIASAMWAPEIYVNNTGGSVNAVAVDTAAHSCIMQKTGTTGRMWIDGTEIGSGVTTGNVAGTLQNIRFGAHYFSGADRQHANGSMWDWGLFSSALTDAERAAFDRGLSALHISQAKLIRYISFAESPVELIAQVAVTDIGSPTRVDSPAYIAAPWMMAATRAAPAAGGSAVGGVLWSSIFRPGSRVAA